MFFFFYMKLDLCILYKAVFCFQYELYLSVTGLLISFHPSIMQSLLPQLASPRLAVRKRAIIAIGECIRSEAKLQQSLMAVCSCARFPISFVLFEGYLVMSCNYTLFNELIEFLLNELIKNTSTSTTRTYIQCVGSIRWVGLIHQAVGGNKGK